MNVVIRQEKREEYKKTEDIVCKAFKNANYSNHDEHILVNHLRKREEFIPELSLVAENNQSVIGYALLTPITIKHECVESVSLALAPVAVLPEFQHNHIGSQLIHKSLEIAKKYNYKSVIVLGDKNYYARFGFSPASKYSISAPFKVDDKHFMALELAKNGLKNTYGEVIYPQEFNV